MSALGHRYLIQSIQGAPIENSSFQSKVFRPGTLEAKEVFFSAIFPLSKSAQSPFE
jgi:hypothetical protein